MTSNSPSSLKNVNSDDLSSISSDDHQSYSPSGRSQLERELESLREKAVARNLRDKYAGSGSFLSPEEAMAYLTKQRKKTSNPPAPPSNLTSSAEISDWYMVQRQRELEERKKREEAEAYLRAYRGNGTVFVESAQQQPQVASLHTPIPSKDRRSGDSSPVTPPSHNAVSPNKETPPTITVPTKSHSVPTKSKPTDTATLSAQNSIAQLDAYLKTVRGAAANQTKQSPTKAAPPNPTSPATSSTQDKRAVSTPTAPAAAIQETKGSPAKAKVVDKVNETKLAVTSPVSLPTAPNNMVQRDDKQPKTLFKGQTDGSPTSKGESNTPWIPNLTNNNNYRMESSSESNLKLNVKGAPILDPKPMNQQTTTGVHDSSRDNNIPLMPAVPNNMVQKGDKQPKTFFKGQTDGPPTTTKVESNTPSIPNRTNNKDRVESSESSLTKVEAAPLVDSPKPIYQQTIGSNNSSPDRVPFDEKNHIGTTNRPITTSVTKISEHRETQVDDSMLYGSTKTSSSTMGQLNTFLRRSVRGSTSPKTSEKPPTATTSSMNSTNEDSTMPLVVSLNQLSLVRNESVLTTSSVTAGESLTPEVRGKKTLPVALRVDTQNHPRPVSEDQYIDLLATDDVQESVQNHPSLNLSLVTPKVFKERSLTGSFSKDSGANTSQFSGSVQMMKYSPAYTDGSISFQQSGDKKRVSESRDSLKSPLQLLEGVSFQNDPMDLLGQDVDVEENRFGSFESGSKMVGRNIWTMPSDDRSLDGSGSVMTSTSISSKSFSQNTEYRSSSAFQKLVQQQKEKYERRLKTRAEEHVEQIDEIIQQLNTIEVKYQTDISNLNGSLFMKESTMDSLQALIDQSRVKNVKAMDEAAQQQAMHSAQRVEYDTIFKVQKDLEANIQGVQNEIKNTLTQREKLIADAVRKAQEEIKVEAERQFAQSNIAFIQMKKDLVAIDAEKKLWFKRAEEATSKLDDINSNANRRIDDISRQLNNTKEELEGSKADVSRLKQQMGNDRTAFTNRVENMTKDLTRLSKECAEANQLAETIEREKIQLKQEADELKGLSEELMSIVVDDKS